MRRRIVPLLVLLVGLGLFWATRERSPAPPGIEVSSDVAECRRHLLAIYDGLRAYHERFGRLPERAGVGFLASLVADGIWENDEAHAALLTCPGPGARPVTPTTDLSDPSTWTEDSSAYAGRDPIGSPIEKFPAGGPAASALAACDNQAGCNHPGILNVLYTDRTVRTFELAALLRRGEVPPGTEHLIVGPDSPLSGLRVLSVH
ncbi:MAG TPA: hypothetical protein ENJ09_07570 [Planctomycetes bacterium]|nr:hypothetical protein [Planctomycetota bacterium]